MGRNKRGTAATILLAGVLSLGLVFRLLARAPHAPPRRAAAAPYVHPIVPSTPVVHPAPPACRVPDLFGATAAVRHIGATAAGACREAAATRARIDALGAAVSGCVARDAELDSQWNLVQAAVLELRACTDCTAPGAKHCARVSELLSQAEIAAHM